MYQERRRRVEPKLKPLFANLKRFRIGKYLYTKEFEYFAIENNIDEVWSECKSEVNSQKNVISIGYHDTEDEEEAFLYLMDLWYRQSYESFGEFITTILLNFAEWHSTKVDYTAIHHNLKQIGLNEQNLLNFTKDARKIRDSKPDKIEEKLIVTKNTPKIKVDSRKIFIVHGHDDKAKLQLSKILKDDLGFEPVILQEESNVSLETLLFNFSMDRVPMEFIFKMVDENRL